LLQQLDLAELHSFEEARELSNSLLKEWLATYKFKDWTITETHRSFSRGGTAFLLFFLAMACTSPFSLGLLVPLHIIGHRFLG